MITSIAWLNRYLDPGNLTPDEGVQVLEATSFPIESREDLENGDVAIDVEVTSNRGDCLCHLGLARELAAATGRTLRPPVASVAPARKPGPVASITSVENKIPDLCPRFTARVIQGVKVGPSPKWLVEALESIGQRSINNVVDASNFVLFELGHPSHTFDLDMLDGKRLIVRHAADGETLKALDGKVHKLVSDDLVVADASKPVSLAGIVGGRHSGVTEKTRNILLEVATWNPPTIRRTARRLDIRTDAGYRFERFVDPRDIPDASARLAELILELAGGELIDGMIDEGGKLQPQTKLALRLRRVEHVLGKSIPVEEITQRLTTVGITVAPRDADTLECTVPHHRPDLTREIDLIEEVARLHGLDQFEIAPRLEVPLDIDHPQDWANREAANDLISQTLTSLGFYETVTFSFLNEGHAIQFLPEGHRLLRVDEERRKGSPYLRPSIIPSLLTCRRANQDGQVRPEGGVRLFETASIFAEIDDADTFGRKTVEVRKLALLIDAGTKHEQQQHSIRTLRSAIETIVRVLGGPQRRIDTQSMEPIMPAMEGGVFAKVSAGGAALGYFGLMSPQSILPWDLDETVAVAELDIPELIKLYPPKAQAHTLPAFPAIERDLSLIVQETTPWSDVEGLVRGLRLARLESCDFVGTYRGKQVGDARKSVTLRLRFRDASRTLRHEEIDPEVDRVVSEAKSRLNAELRA